MKPWFDLPLTEDEAYWCGLVHADGYISRKRRYVNLTQKDRFVLEEFLRFLGQDSKITHATGRTTFGQANIYGASTTKGVAQLLELGVKGSLTTPLTSSRHFWRGMIDGDGSVFVTGRGVPTLSLCGAQEDVEAFSTWCGKLLDCEGPAVSNTRRTCWIAGLGGSKAVQVAAHLYTDGYSAVTRKRDVALSFVEKIA